MVRKGKKHSFNYYFLNKYISVEKPRGYRQTVMNLLINENNGENNGKFLFVQEKGGTWGLSRQGVVAQDLLENLFETLVRNLGEELGFKGIIVHETKPIFKQKTYLFNFAKQTYDAIRSKAEEKKNRPTKGKIYHLAIMSYKGPDDLPIHTEESKSVINDYKWVNENEAIKLNKKNYEIIEKRRDYSKASIDFQKILSEKIIYTYKKIISIYSYNNSKQSMLFNDN